MRLVLSLLIALMFASAPAGAQGLLGSYSAWIGQQDLYNSRGQRLTETWQIIRQDRANFHRFNRRDPGDGNDPWFANANARASLEQAMMNVYLTPNQRAMILQGGSWVQLDLYGWSSQQITAINLMVWR
jgi:hypothetical protein